MPSVESSASGLNGGGSRCATSAHGLQAKKRPINIEILAGQILHGEWACGQMGGHLGNRSTCGIELRASFLHGAVPQGLEIDALVHRWGQATQELVVERHDLAAPVACCCILGRNEELDEVDENLSDEALGR